MAPWRWAWLACAAGYDPDSEEVDPALAGRLFVLTALGRERLEAAPVALVQTNKLC